MLRNVKTCEKSSQYAQAASVAVERQNIAMFCIKEGPQMQIRHAQAQSAADLLLVGVDVNSCYITSVTMLPECQASLVSV